MDDGQPLKTIPVGQNPAAVTFGLDSVWVANGGDGTIIKSTPVLDRAVSFQIGDGLSGIAIVRGKVWITNELAGTVSRSDPATRRPTTVPIGQRPSAVARGDGTVYVALPDRPEWLTAGGR